MEYLAKGERKKAFLPALCVAVVASFAISSILLLCIVDVILASWGRCC